MFFGVKGGKRKKMRPVFFFVAFGEKSGLIEANSSGLRRCPVRSA
jgi:hypothetical protein